MSLVWVDLREIWNFSRKIIKMVKSFARNQFSFYFCWIFPIHLTAVSFTNEHCCFIWILNEVRVDFFSSFVCTKIQFSLRFPPYKHTLCWISCFISKKFHAPRKKSKNFKISTVARALVQFKADEKWFNQSYHNIEHCLTHSAMIRAWHEVMQLRVHSDLVW